MRNFFVCLFFVFGGIMFAQSKLALVQEQIEKGNFMNAHEMIENFKEDASLSHQEIEALEFEQERMDRILKDFNKSESDILKYLEKYYPGITAKDLVKWEKTNKLEHKVINGKKYYFARSQRNLFLIDKDAKLKKEEVDGPTVDELDTFLEKYIPKVVESYTKTKNNLINPVKMELNYTVTVQPNAVPDGEVIRCWLPYPREGHNRQADIKLISVNSNNYIIAENSNLQRTLYLEKVAEKDKPTVFNFEVSFAAAAEFHKIDENSLKGYDVNSDVYKNYTKESAPHILFTEKIKKASAEIVGNEKNPYLIAKKIFTWINNNIPWAGAREYSTLYNIPEYCLANGHGDCGIKSLLFITLCRYNGVPAKWQSGWMLHPGQVNLHDWAEAYFEGYGWVPVDQSFGITKSDDTDVNYFYLGGMDSYRLIVNDDIAQPLFPAKLFPRSETVDFQRGEVEWKKGNLYFDKWDYDMKVKYSE